MTANQPAFFLPRAARRAVRRVARALRALQNEQVRMWEAWLQANRTVIPETGTLTWFLTLDGHRLADRDLPGPPAPQEEKEAPDVR
jgi:hypothetical protein